MHKQQTTELRTSAANFSSASGEKISQEIEKNSLLLVHWIEYLSAFHLTGTANSLLHATSSSIRESAGLLSLGLARATLFALRGQIDLALGWLYFKDHAVEWSYVNDTAEGFKLKKELLQYLDQHNPKFSMRIGILREIRTRREADPYRLLSAHIHAQSDPVLPAVAQLRDLVQPESMCAECSLVAFEASEYLNDIFLSIFLASWASLPTPIQTAASARFQSDAQRATFFS